MSKQDSDGRHVIVDTTLPEDIRVRWVPGDEPRPYLVDGITDTPLGPVQTAALLLLLDPASEERTRIWQYHDKRHAYQTGMSDGYEAGIGDHRMTLIGDAAATT